MSWFIVQASLYLTYFETTRYTVLAQCQTCQLNHHRLPDFDGKSVSDFPLATQGGLGKLWMCTRVCFEDSRCRSYRYNSMTGVCSTYGIGYFTPGNTFNSVTMETGSQLLLMCGKTHALGTACTSTLDCDPTSSTCRNGYCECSLGYSYDVITGNCVTECAVYGDTFVEYSNYGVSYCNTMEDFTPTSDECMEACKKQTDFVCINAEYEISSGECNMCHRTWFDIDPEDRQTDQAGWTLFYRYCAV